jgi:arsenate reductase (thioredoxin)
MEKIKVLFLCTHNSARSQMAEGLLRHLAGNRFEVMSAGTEATQVRPLAMRAMSELGIDISSQESKTLNRYLGEPFNYVITVCDEANEACPFFPGAAERLQLVSAGPRCGGGHGGGSPGGLPVGEGAPEEPHRRGAAKRGRRLKG